MKELFGKYRGKVANNVDPLQQGRIQVSVPAVLGEGRLAWALPCVPYAGPGVGFFTVPPIGGNVWVKQSVPTGFTVVNSEANLVCRTPKVEGGTYEI